MKECMNDGMISCARFKKKNLGPKIWDVTCLDPVHMDTNFIDMARII
jgi:hypothetical protein